MIEHRKDQIQHPVKSKSKADSMLTCILMFMLITAVSMPPIIFLYTAENRERLFNDAPPPKTAPHIDIHRFYLEFQELRNHETSLTIAHNALNNCVAESVRLEEVQPCVKKKLIEFKDATQ